MDAVRVQNLSKSFSSGAFRKPTQVLFDVSFNLIQGRTTGFIGGNGQGKTTTLKCILEFVFPDKGEVLFWEKNLSKESRLKIGYLPERPYFYGYLTAFEFLKLHWDLGKSSSSKEFKESADQALQRVDLSVARDLKLSQFSKGMLQRIGLAQALLHKPELLILDEPVSGLDPDGRWIVKEILHEQKKMGMTLFFSSHLLQDMDDLCDDLVVIDHGRIIFTGPTAEFKKNHRDLEAAFQANRKRLSK